MTIDHFCRMRWLNSECDNVGLWMIASPSTLFVFAFRLVWETQVFPGQARLWLKILAFARTPQHLFSVFNNSNPQCIGISHTNKSGTAAKGLLYFIQNTIPKEEYSSTRSIVKFDLIWYQILDLKIAMATLRRHRFNEAYLPAHCLLWLLFWLDRALQHMC